jgi:hypothetical protein
MIPPISAQICPPRNIIDHCPAVTCLPDALPVSAFIVHHLTIISAVCPLVCALTAVQLRINASFGIRMNRWQQRYMIPSELGLATSRAVVIKSRLYNSTSFLHHKRLQNLFMHVQGQGEQCSSHSDCYVKPGSDSSMELTCVEGKCTGTTGQRTETKFDCGKSAVTTQHSELLT